MPNGGHLEAAVLGEPHVHPAAPVNEGLQHLGTRLVVELEPHALGARRVVLAPLHHLVGEGPKRVLRRRAAASCVCGAEMRRAQRHTVMQISHLYASALLAGLWTSAPPV